MKFDSSTNKLRANGAKTLAGALKGNQVMQELNIADNELSWDANRNDDMSGVIAISDAIPTMGALTSLNLAKNQLGAEGAKHVAKAIKVHVSALQFVWYHLSLI